MAGYRVSLATVRNALELLKEQGLVESRTGSGIRVVFDGAPAAPDIPFDPRRDIHDLFAMRAIVEPEALKDAFDRLDSDGLAAAFDAVDLRDADSIQHADALLHGEVFERCRNPVSPGRPGRRHAADRTVPATPFPGASRGPVRSRVETVGDTIRAIGEGNRRRAVSRMRKHIERTGESLLAFLDTETE